MPDALLRTKLFIPPIRPSRVPRSRLRARLDQGLHLGHKLLLVSAPAGFGKSMLVGEWVDSLRLETDQNDVSAPAGSQRFARQSPIVTQVAWYSLDAGDNDLGQFLRYLVTAVDQVTDTTIGASALEILRTSAQPPVTAVLTPLLNELAALPDRLLLVFDDYHLIEAQPVHDALHFLLNNSPPSLHIVMATREDPPLPLARFRARAQLTELRAADLRFTVAEAADFLNRVMGLDLTTESIAALETRTEGWITGLQLAAISMQGNRDSASFIQSFTGSHRYILDYLVEEVLLQQADEVQTFLLQTAVLNRLTAPLCNLLTGQTHAQATLEMLDQANLFIIPLDHERRWYRYHHLFDELLQQQLRIKFPTRANELHAKAALWYEAQGDLSEAIYHALAGNDVETAVRLIEKEAVNALEQSDFRFIFNAVERLPEGTVDKSPWLFVFYTLALLLVGQFEAAAPKLENTDWLMDAVADEDAHKKQEMLGYVAALNVQLSGWRRNYSPMRAFVQQVFASFPENHWISAYTYMFLGTGCWGDGDLKAAYTVFNKALTIGKVIGNRRVVVTGAIYLGHTLDLQGRLQEAAAHFQDSFQLVEQDGRELPLAAYLHIDFARILYELNELAQASQHLAEGIQLSRILADSRIEKLGYCFLARVHAANGDFARAIDAVHKAELAHPGAAPAVDMRGGEYPQVTVWLQQGQLQKVAHWLNESAIDPQSVPHFKTRLTLTMHARALIALGRNDANLASLHEALALLEALLTLAETNEWHRKVIEILVLQALALDTKGDTVQAMTKLARALRLAQPEGYIRTFVDEGEPMARLLQIALRQGIAPAYVQRLLALLITTSLATPVDDTAEAELSALFEPLSEREIEVLEHIAAGLTNREIGARLHLTLNTVKAHTRNIYGKLDVHNRTTAVAKARALAILSAE